MYSNNKTKIVATIGPASSSKDALRELITAGVNVFRLNFSHSSHEEHLEVIKNIRELNEELNTTVATLADLQGPKLRIGEVFENAVKLKEGTILEFTNEKCLGTAQKVYMSYKNFPNDVKPGDKILIDDGKLLLETISTNNIDSVKAKVIYGGILSSKKGVNLPNTKISLPSLTKKDLDDALFAIENDVDWIALSFVRNASDLNDLKEIINNKGKSVRIISKIEKPEALDDIDEIIKASNGIMVARGDLGVELPFNQVPLIQKMIVDKCIKLAKPVIIATQMLESMITNATPTRAEANDVANAVIDGASAVMLSGETSVGKHPVLVIEAMKKILMYTEKNRYQYDREHEIELKGRNFISDSICLSACRLAQRTCSKSLVVMTLTGYTAFRIANHRPNANIYVFTPDKKLQRQMSLLWGVKTFYCPEFTDIDKAIDYTCEKLQNADIVHENDILVHVGSIPLNKDNKTNMVKITQL